MIALVIGIIIGGIAGYQTAQVYARALPLKPNNGTNAMSRCCGADIDELVDGYDGTPIGYCCAKCGEEVDLDARVEQSQPVDNL